MINYEPPAIEIVDFGISNQWNDVVCSNLPGYQGPVIVNGKDKEFS